MNQVFVKPVQCTGCRSCEIACAIQHSQGKSLLSAMTQSPKPMKRLFIEQARGVKMPVICRHCEDAPCVSACISGCLYRDKTGFVLKHEQRCIGCWSCAMVCPFGVVSRDADKRIAEKCDRCNELDVPACVNACPTHALFMAEVDGMSREKRLKLVLAQAPSES